MTLSISRRGSLGALFAGAFSSLTGKASARGADIVPGSTKALALSSPPPEQTVFETTCFAEIDDEGGAKFRRLALNEPSIAGDIRTANGIFLRLVSGSHVSVCQFGAMGRSGDDTDAIKAAIAHAEAVSKPIHLPKRAGFYGVRDTIPIKTGLAGGGGTLKAINSENFLDGRPILRIGWPASANASLCEAIPLHDFRIQGLAILPEIRTAQQSAQQFNGDGIVVDEQCSGLTLRDVLVENCRRGISFCNRFGHIYLDAVNCRYNWIGLYIGLNTGDFCAFASNLSGNLFASISADNSTKGSGGIVGLTLIRCQLGFGPYGIYLPDGNSEAGLANFTALHTSFEAIGNAAIRIGEDGRTPNRVCYDWELIQCIHTWVDQANAAEKKRFCIDNDPAHPVQQFAVLIQQLNACGITYRGSGWSVGTSGYHTRIDRLYAWVNDNSGIAGYLVNDGRERLIPTAQPYFQIWQHVPPIKPQRDFVTVATFDIPKSLSGIVKGIVDIDFHYENTGSRQSTIEFELVCTGGRVVRSEPSPRYCPPGKGNILAKMAIDLERRNYANDEHSVALRMRSLDIITEKVIFNSPPSSGIVLFTMSQTSGIV